MTRNWLARLSVLVLLLFSFAGARAQTSSSMTGIVTDSSGAVIAGAKVLLLNPARGIDAEATTDKDGSYRFPNVPAAPGYKATFTRDGFAPVTVSDISLQVALTRTQNVTLSAGTNQTVEVSVQAGEQTLNTTDASIGTNFDPQLLNDLPVQNRASVSALFILQPGVTNTGSVTGARTDQSSVTVDGMDVNDLSTGQFGNTNGSIPVDATQEFRGTVAGLPANIGTGSGGQFQLVTKSGTNKFHGNLNEYHRDTATVANLFFNKNATTVTPRLALVRNQFGAAVGGPIWRDKLFFFADIYSQRQASALSGVDTVPLDSFKAGNISYVKAGCAATTRQTSANASTCIGTLTPAQVKALDPKGVGENATVFSLLASRYPSANDLTVGDGVNTGGLRFTQATLNVIYDGVAKLDYNLTSKQRVFLQFHEAHQDSVQAVNRFPGDPLTRPFRDRSYGYVGSHIWEIGGNKVNQFYYGSTITVFEFPLDYNPTGASYLGSLSGILTTPYDASNIQRRRVPVPTVRDDFNWTIGTHNISFGGLFKSIKASNFLGSDYNAYTLGTGGNVASLTTSLRPADLSTSTTNQAQFDNAYVLALGRVARVSSIYNFNAAGTQLPSGTGANRRYRYFQTEAYVGDTWKVNKQLTLTYGVRYSHYSVPYEALGAQSTPQVSFDTYLAARFKQNQAGVSGNTSVPLFVYNLSGKANNAPDLYAGNFKDFAPRIAVAYNPAYLPHTVFNASADIVYDRTVANAVNFLQNQSTFLFQNSTAVSYGNAADPASSLINDPRVGSSITALPAPPTIAAPGKPYTPNVDASGNLLGIRNSLTAYNIDPNLKDPYNISFNVGVQQEFQGHFLLRANYVGRLGRRLLAQADASQLIDFPDLASGQSTSAAFAAITTAKRAQTNAGISNAPNSIAPIPWFEHVLTPNYYVGRSCGVQNGVGAAQLCNSNTAFVAFNQASLVQLGDITDILAAYHNTGAIAPNVGIDDQFARNTFYTNKGSSNYHGLLVSLSKNLSQGVQFDFNYTFQHSIDNVSVIANSVASGTGFLCDALNARACRGNSDFDVTNVISSDFVVQLPVGRGRTFASHIPWYLNEVIGGWSVSGIPIWQSGYAYTTSTGAFFSSFANNAPAIYDGSRSDDVATHVNKDALGRIVAYKDVNKALSHFRGPLGIEYGSRNPLRGPSQFYMDAGLSKKFQILPSERLNAVFRADFFNVLNHPTFATPNASITSAAFGQITATQSPFAGAANRIGQFSLRLEF